MGIYIKDEKMPTNCMDCFYIEHCTKCIFKKININKDEIIFKIGKIPDNCPLIEIEVK